MARNRGQARTRKPDDAAPPGEPVEKAETAGTAVEDEGTTKNFKVHRADAILLSKIAAMLGLSQADTVATFRRDFENLYRTLLAAEQKKLSEQS